MSLRALSFFIGLCGRVRNGCLASQHLFWRFEAAEFPLTTLHRKSPYSSEKAVCQLVLSRAQHDYRSITLSERYRGFLIWIPRSLPHLASNPPIEYFLSHTENGLATVTFPNQVMYALWWPPFEVHYHGFPAIVRTHRTPRTDDLMTVSDVNTGKVPTTKFTPTIVAVPQLRNPPITTA